jgi:hypothetical protein
MKNRYWTPFSDQKGVFYILFVNQYISRYLFKR